MKTSFLQTSTRRSPLFETLHLSGSKAKNSHQRRELAIALPLTSLIDAFSIIVIYLLMGSQSTGVETKLAGKINLPLASHSQAVEKETAILRIEEGNYYLNDEIVAKKELAKKLTDFKKTKQEQNKEQNISEEIELMIQADTEMKYADLDPLLKAGSQAGIEKLKFAVVPKP